MEFFFKGIVLGFAIAAPVGPIGILCIKRTLQFGRLSGLFSGIGAAVADAIYAVVAAFGLTAVSDVLIAYKTWIQGFGAFFLVYLGVRTFRAKIQDSSVIVSHSTLIGDFLSTFALTITNPMTILSFVAVFAGLGFSGSAGTGVSLVLGVFVGSVVWWLLLSEGITFFRKKISRNLMWWINRAAGLLMIGFAIFFLAWKGG